MVHRANCQLVPPAVMKLHKSSAGTIKKSKDLSRQILRFGMVGVVGFVVNAGMVEWLAYSIGPVWAQFMAFPAAASATWWLNRRYTFGVSSFVWYLEWIRYVFANAFGWSANNGVYFLLILQFESIYENPAFAVAAGSLMGMGFNFVMSKRVIFNN
jgi:putative flippase GtrA